MKKIKLLFLILGLFLLSGCTFEYNINVDKNVISENNIVYIRNTTYGTVENTFENLVSKYTGPTNSLGMYESSVVQRDDIFGVSYKKNYSFNNYNNSVSFSSCYDSYKLVNDGEKITIATSDVFKCFDIYEELDKVVVNLTTDYYVEQSNADNINGNKYTWNINKDNYEQKQISVVIDLDKVSRKKNIFSNDVFLLVLGAFILIGIIVLFVMRRSKKINKI